MRILQLVHTSIQFEPVTFALGRLMADRAHKVICVGYWLPGLPVEQEEAPDYCLIRISRGGYQKLPRILRGGLRIARYWKGVLQVARAFHPDIVISYGYDVLPIAFRLVRSSDRVVYYCTEYSPAPHLKQYLTGWGLLKQMERRYVKSAGILVSVEPNRARLQEQDWGRSVDHIILNTPLYEPELEALATSRILCKPGEVRLVYAGSIGARNCLTELMETVAEIPGASLAIYGRVVADFERPFQEVLQRSSAASNDRIRYHGALEYSSLAQELTNYDVGICFYDGKDTNTRFASPAKIFEYMRAGLAFVTTPQPTPEQIVQDSASGFVVDLNVPGQLSHVLRSLIQRPEMLKQMRHNALQSFRERYAYERQVKTLIDRIEQIGQA